MKFYKNETTGEVFAYDETDESQLPYIQSVVEKGYLELDVWPPVPSLVDRQFAVWTAIKAERDRRNENGGYKVAVDGVDKWFHSDTFSRSQQLGLVLMGSSIPAGLLWKTMDGSYVTMTAELAASVLAAATAQDIATFTAAETHKAAMEALAVPSDYDYSAGWPDIYVAAE